MELCVEAGWRDRMIPKFHWMIHYPAHLERYGTLVTCFVHERKHKLAKRYGTDIHNTRSYGKSVLSEIVAHQLWQVNNDTSFDLSSRLVEPHRASKKVKEHVRVLLNVSDGEVWTCVKGVVAPMTQVRRGDILLVRSPDSIHFVAGEVWLLASINDQQPFGVVSLWDIESNDSAKGLALWRKVDNPVIVPFASMLKPVIWSESRAGVIRTLTPYEFRGMLGASMP